MASILLQCGSLRFAFDALDFRIRRAGNVVEICGLFLEAHPVEGFGTLSRRHFPGFVEGHWNQAPRSISCAFSSEILALVSEIIMSVVALGGRFKAFFRSIISLSKIILVSSAFSSFCSSVVIRLL